MNRNKAVMMNRGAKNLEEEEARHLDKFQNKVLHVAIRFAQNLMISKKGKLHSPSAPLLMVQEGLEAGNQL